MPTGRRHPPEWINASDYLGRNANLHVKQQRCPTTTTKITNTAIIIALAIVNNDDSHQNMSLVLPCLHVPLHCIDIAHRSSLSDILCVHGTPEIIFEEGNAPLYEMQLIVVSWLKKLNSHTQWWERRGQETKQQQQRMLDTTPYGYGNHCQHVHISLLVRLRLVYLLW